jgi:hypothetical protein
VFIIIKATFNNTFLMQSTWIKITYLKNTLQTKGYICGIHEEDFIIGKSYLYNVETCIKSAVVIVPWISEEFLKSPTILSQSWKILKE